MPENKGIIGLLHYYEERGEKFPIYLGEFRNQYNSGSSEIRIWEVAHLGEDGSLYVDWGDVEFNASQNYGSAYSSGMTEENSGRTDLDSIRDLFKHRIGELGTLQDRDLLEQFEEDDAEYQLIKDNPERWKVELKRQNQEKKTAVIRKFVAMGNSNEISWDCLKIDYETNCALMISSDIITIMPYNESSNYSAWATSSLRSALNTTILLRLFSPIQIESIANLEQQTPNHFGEFETTSDKLFILSAEETLQYFGGNAERIAKYKGEICAWWLRDGPNDAFTTACVRSDGSINNFEIISPRIGVRPAFWLHLDSESNSPTENTELLDEESRFGNEEIYSQISTHFNSLDSSENAISWRCIQIERDPDRALLLSQDIIGKRRYNETHDAVSWATCSLRHWLNTEFLNSLNYNQQKLIRNSNNVTSSVIGTKKTVENVFLLSESEVNCYILGNEICIANIEGAPDFWWLRTQGSNAGRALFINEKGAVDYDGEDSGVARHIVNNYYGVRPAIWVNIDSTVVTSESFASFKYSDRKSKQQISDSFNEENSFQKSQASDISWFCVDVDNINHRALLLTQDVVSLNPYNSVFERTSWESSNLRKWLNTEFLQSSFSYRQANAILESELSCYANDYYTRDICIETVDKVFLLSLEDTDKYINNREEWLAKYDDKGSGEHGEGVFPWWLRSSGANEGYQSFVAADGFAYSWGYPVNTKNVGIRPAIWVDLAAL